MIEAIESIKAYDQKNFVEQVVKQVTMMEMKKLEVEIQYSYWNENYTALIIGRKVKKNESGKTIR